MKLQMRTRTKIFIFILPFTVIVFSEAQQCSGRLENALEQMRRRSSQPKARSFDETPYSVYQSIYGNNKEDFEYDDEGASRSKLFDRSRKHFLDAEFDAKTNRQPHSIPVSKVDVEDLKVRLPQKAARWVEVDKCRFSTANRTLDTRLIFPDLTISGKVVLYPTGGRCNMILRLRHAGIEFRTVPMAGLDESRNSRPVASVRTDSHFAEPGFISVFAHGCQGPTGIKLRQNSKRRFGFGDNDGPASDSYPDSNTQRRWGKFYSTYRPPYDPRDEQPLYRRRYTRQASSEGHFEDLVQFEDDVFHFNDDLNALQPDARAFADIFTENLNMERSSPSKWLNVADFGSTTNTNTDDSINNALTKELEQLFSMGVKGLLTKYMQRALQPAIKETLMENMGYTLSYG
ncbi:uncharacterized protein LOC129939420 [Eupeodes corollae]|uniref:uncharacterized protein LOC129939420 n=1 Tax=Eupeodes corollae TaxID=290404 RepID=UPI002490EA15|nr:uncharacterized protein LOC129939420 [Eupeodes corollae]XP_055903399.1 uncharacterized protein LOC129939420 [Eupeodes corollae]